MTTAVDSIVEILAANSLGTAGTNLFANYTPPSPDELIGVFTSPVDVEPEMTFGAGLSAIENSRVQIFCRGNQDDFDTPKANAIAARALLGVIANQTFYTVHFLRIQPLGDIAPLPTGPDVDLRPVFIFNLAVAVIPS